MCICVECLGVRCADTGQQLDPKEVLVGRKREIGEIQDFSSWDYVHPSECRGGKTVKTRWVDRGTQDGGVKSRFVAMEIAWERFEAVAAATRRGLDENP